MLDQDRTEYPNPRVPHPTYAEVGVLLGISGDLVHGTQSVEIG
jgi:hypothetical protein